MRESLNNYLKGADPLGTMALTFVFWLCTLVLVALIVLPLLGIAVALIAAAALLLASLPACWSICTYRIAK